MCPQSLLSNMVGKILLELFLSLHPLPHSPQFPVGPLVVPPPPIGIPPPNMVQQQQIPQQQLIQAQVQLPPPGVHIPTHQGPLVPPQQQQSQQQPQQQHMVHQVHHLQSHNAQVPQASISVTLFLF